LTSKSHQEDIYNIKKKTWFTFFITHLFFKNSYLNYVNLHTKLIKVNLSPTFIFTLHLPTSIIYYVVFMKNIYIHV